MLGLEGRENFVRCIPDNRQRGPGDQVSHLARAEALHRGERGGREGVAPGWAWGWGLPSKQLRRWAEARKRHSLEWDADSGVMSQRLLLKQGSGGDLTSTWSTKDSFIQMSTCSFIH